MPCLFRKLIIVLLVLYTGVSSVYGQELRFDRFTTLQGLPSNETFTLLQDKEGYIWICTNYGITKYNGTSFIPVCTNIPFSEQFAYCMYEHPVHGLFFANSRANVYRVKNDSAFMIKGFERISNDLSSRVHEVSSLYVDDSLNIYLFTKGKSYKLQKNNNYREIDLDSCYVPGKADFGVLQIDNNYFPLVDKQRKQTGTSFFCVIENNGKKPLAYPLPALKAARPRLALKKNEGLYLCRDNQLMLLHLNGTFEISPFPGRILAINTDQHNNIWVGCYNNGLYRIDSAGRITDHYFEGISVNYILCDDQNGMWISTTGKGLYHCKNIFNTIYTNIPGLGQRIIRVKTIDSSLFVFTAQNRLYELDPKGISEIMLPSSNRYEVTDIISAPGGYLISTHGNIFRSDKEFRNIKAECDVPAYALEKGEKEYYLINRLAIGKVADCKLPVLGPSKLNHLIHYRNNEFLMATENGLCLVRDSLVYVPPFLEQFKDMTVKRLKRSGDGRIWVCTRGSGLFFIGKNDKVVSCAAPGKIINDVCFPGDTMIAVCCNTGSFITALKNAEVKDMWLNIGQEESLTIDYYNGLLYKGTGEGLVSLNPQYLYDNKNAPLYLAKIKVGDTVITSLSPSFLYNQNSPEFTFEYLDYRGDDKRLLYRLTGPVSKAGLTEGMKLRLENLEAGSYTLIVSPGLYLPGRDHSITIRFTVASPYWKEWWFWVLTITGITGLVTGTTLLLYHRTKRKAHKKIELSRMLAEYKLTALKAQINPHFMSNALVAIQMLVLMNETDKAGQYLAKFNLFIRNVLKYSDKTFIPFSEEMKILNVYIELEMLRFKDTFEFRTEIDPSVERAYVSIPPLIIQPFVENAIWHGLLPLKEERKPYLILKVYRSSNVLVVIIEDNGVGRKNSALKVTKGRESKGNEISINRLEHINQLLGVSSAGLDIEDLKDSEGASAGTRVTITLPCNSTPEEYGTHKLHIDRR